MDQSVYAYHKHTTSFVNSSVFINEIYNGFKVIVNKEIWEFLNGQKPFNNSIVIILRDVWHNTKSSTEFNTEIGHVDSVSISTVNNIVLHCTFKMRWINFHHFKVCCAQFQYVLNLVEDLVPCQAALRYWTFILCKIPVFAQTRLMALGLSSGSFGSKFYILCFILRYF